MGEGVPSSMVRGVTPSGWSLQQGMVKLPTLPASAGLTEQSSSIWTPICIHAWTPWWALHTILEQNESLLP